MKNYINCDTCNYWSPERKIDETCYVCDGRGFILNPDEVLCNNCGSKMCPAPPDPNWQIPNGLHDIKISGDYSSSHLTDTTQYRFSLCELCLRNMFNSFVIPPDTFNEDGDIDLGYESDRTSYEYTQWKAAGLYEAAYLNNKCNSVKNCPNDAKYTILRSDEVYSDFCACENHVVVYESYNWYKTVPFIKFMLKAFI